MRKPLWLVPTLAAAAIAAGCGTQGLPPQQGWQTCVDQQGVIMDDQRCYNPAPHPFYHWYYYPYGGQPYPLGYRIPLGGSYSELPYAGIATRTGSAPIAGARTAPATAPRSGVTTGGFGATAHGEGAGE